jgi:uncharacterized protein involved in high-affinity Fe2+ transport
MLHEVLRTPDGLHRLAYDSDDVAEIEAASVYYDKIDDTPEGAMAVRWKLTDAHLDLRLKFKPGTSAKWLPVETDKEV